MSDTKFTKGEWILKNHEPFSDWSVEANHEEGGFFDMICELGDEANAHLIAAAPEMYAMLKEARKLCHSGGYFDTRDKIDSILAKARGEL